MARPHRQIHGVRRAAGRSSSPRACAAGSGNARVSGQPTDPAYDNAVSTSGTRLSGLSAGAYRLTGTPSLPTRNFVKFHLIPSVPRMPGRDFFKYSYNGCASGPLTLTLANIGKLTP